jgi:hypothetical protein
VRVCVDYLIEANPSTAYNSLIMGGTTTKPREGCVRLRSGRHALGDEGMTVVEVMVSVVVFLLVLVPFAALLEHTDSQIANSQDAITATGVLDSVTAQLQNSAFPGTWPTTLTHAAAWTAASPATLKTNGIRFHIYEAGGWCALTATKKIWGTYKVPTGTHGTYHVQVKVTWGPGATSPSTAPEYVRGSTELPKITGVATPTTPSAGKTVSSCSLKLK